MFTVQRKLRQRRGAFRASCGHVRDGHVLLAGHVAEHGEDDRAGEQRRERVQSAHDDRVAVERVPEWVVRGEYDHHAGGHAD